MIAALAEVISALALSAVMVGTLAVLVVGVRHELVPHLPGLFRNQRDDFRTASIDGAAAFDRDHTVPYHDGPDMSDLSPADFLPPEPKPAAFCVGEDPWAEGPDGCMCGLPGCPSTRYGATDLAAMPGLEGEQ